MYIPPFDLGLQVCCGTTGVKAKHIADLPSEAALKEYNALNACPPKEAGKFTLKLLGIFFSPEELSHSNCTKAEGRDLLDPNVILGIKRHGFTNFKYPDEESQEEARWQRIVVTKLNPKCRSVFTT